ncbi:peptide-methionine (R)-S-oxide reductase MsrB [Roseovarius sp. S4756]|uniref:peptide-methionine (R)-S-oxide reductase MsrB n=1 Tax=Roseovarius maritimus TaxID=3342637 RepID=UPI0037296B82
MDRRHFITAALAAGSAAAFARFGGAAAPEGNFEITRTEAEWRAMLTELEYAVMREEATERAFTSPLDKNYDDGTYVCRGCDLPLYASDVKYDSGTGWPSFWQAKEGAIGTKADRSLFGVRTECHCSRCGSHLGHIFDDGPAPTGKRHCINGVSLTFVAA